MNTIKTSKQIYLLAKEVGEKNKEQFELADEISIEKTNYDSWIGAIQKLTSLNLMPPMNKGVFIVKDSTYTGRLLFECEIEDDGHAEFAFSAFLHTNARINYLMEHPEKKEIIKIEGRKPNSVKEKPTSYKKECCVNRNRRKNH